MRRWGCGGQAPLRSLPLPLPLLPGDCTQPHSSFRHRLPPKPPPTHTRSTPNGFRFRLLMWDNVALVTSGGLRRNKHIGIAGLEWFQIEQIQDAAQRWVGALFEPRSIHHLRVAFGGWCTPVSRSNKAARWPRHRRRLRRQPRTRGSGTRVLHAPYRRLPVRPPACPTVPPTRVSPPGLD